MQEQGRAEGEAAPAGPVVRWTPAEAWLMAELAQRALVASLDGGPPVRAAAGAGALVAEIQATQDSIALELRIDADRAAIALRPERPLGHRWRDGWSLVIVRDGERLHLAAGGPPIELHGVRRSPVRVELFVQHRAIFGVVGADAASAGSDARELVPLADAAFHRYTRQSSVTAGAGGDGPELRPWMAPTQPEAAPWWELDLGRPMCVAHIRIDLERPPPGTRIVCRAFGFGRPSGAMWPDSAGWEGSAEAIAEPWFEVGGPIIARYVRVELEAPAGARVALAITASEVAASEICADTLLGSMRRAFAVFGARPLVLGRDGDDGPYEPRLTYDGAWRRAAALARGLALRLEPGLGERDRPVLGVMLRNRPEWILAELAALVRGYVVVAMSPEDADERLAQVLDRARPTGVICEVEDADRVARLAPGLRVVAACDVDEAGGDGEGEGSTGAGDAGPVRIGVAALIAAGERAAVPLPRPRSEDDPYAVLFTSGSTGAPKGAVRTYRTFHTMIGSYALGHSPRHLSFQPLSHLSERMYLPSLLLHGGAIAFSRGGAHLLDELRALEPTSVGSVPRLFEVLHARHQRRVRASLAEDPAAPAAAIEAASLAETRRALGGRLLAVSVGSAPVGDEVYAFMKRCFGDIWVSEGYGSTEVGSIAFDGKILPHVEVKLVPVAGAAPPEPGAPERGEIYVRTPHAIAGYLGEGGAMTQAIDGEGYFATGDLGERGADGRVRVIGRLRNTVKLAQGEFISIERIEVALAAAAIVDQVFVHVAHGAPGCGALVVPHADALARALGADGAPLAELVALPGAAAAVLRELCAHGRAAGLAPYELPRAVLLEAAPLTVEAGLLTASGKLARSALAERYGARLAALAAEEGGGAVDASAVPAAGSILDRIVQAASAVAGRAIDPRESIGTGLGVDSLAAAEILEAMSRALGREVPLGWWFEAASLADLADRLASPIHGAGANAALAAEDRARSPRLEASASVSAASAEARPIRTVLVTGATGFLGAHLVESLCARGLDVVCLVRAPDDAVAEVRLARALADRAIPAPPPGRARAIAGDLAAPDRLAALAESAALADLDAIVHAGATVSWLASYPALRAPNVLGTIALLELAAARGIPLHHVSTISTVPPDGDEASRLAFESALAATPYALSKWLAEDHALRAAAAGAPVTVYRPAMIAAHTARGLGNPDDFLTRYLAGCLELGRYLDDESAVIDMTPVDFVAGAIAAVLAARPRDRGVYHLANADQSLTYGALGRALVAAGAPVQPAPYAAFRAVVIGDRTCRLHALAAFFPERFSLGMGPWPCRRSVETLAALGVARPRIDDAIIARYVAGLRR